MNHEIKTEIYKAFVLLGAGSDLLGTIGSWEDSLPDEDVLCNLYVWNKITQMEIKGRIEHYEMTSHRSVDNRGEDEKKSY